MKGSGLNSFYIVVGERLKKSPKKKRQATEDVADLVCAQTRMALETKSAQKSHFETTRVTLKTPTI